MRRKKSLKQKPEKHKGQKRNKAWKHNIRKKRKTQGAAAGFFQGGADHKPYKVQNILREEFQHHQVFYQHNDTSDDEGNTGPQENVKLCQYCNKQKTKLKDLKEKLQYFLSSSSSGNKISVTNLCEICKGHIRQISAIYGLGLNESVEGEDRDVVEIIKPYPNYIPSSEAFIKVQQYIKQEETQKRPKNSQLTEMGIGFVQGKIVSTCFEQQATIHNNNLFSQSCMKVQNSTQISDVEEEDYDFEIVKAEDVQMYEGMSVQRSIALERAIGTPHKFVAQEITGSTLTSIFKTKQLMRAAKKKEKKQARREAVKNGEQQQHQFAHFEKYNNGIASKMMAKMGYIEGQGLGKDSQGRKEPLKQQIRPKNLGLGC